MEDLNRNIDELAYINDRLDNLSKYVLAEHKNMKIVFNLLQEYKITLNDLAQSNKDLHHKITSLDDKINRIYNLLTGNIDCDNPNNKGKCKYSDKQLYDLFINKDNKYKKRYSYSDLVKLTGMSKSYLQRHIREYRLNLFKEGLQ